ncbi:MAG: hypothetical protein ACKO3G_04700, partial [Planctomycetaceae bacterium]
PIDIGGTYPIGFTAPVATGNAATFAFKPADDGLADDGIFIVAVTATDKPGGVAIQDFPVQVRNVAPTAKLVTADAKILYEQGAKVTFRLDEAFDPSDADKATLTYSFDLDDDGSWEVVNATSNVFTTPALLEEGTRTVRARVADDDGGVFEGTLPVSIVNDSPEVTALANRVTTSAARMAAFSSLALNSTLGTPPITAPGRRIVLDGTFADAGLSVDAHRGEVVVRNERTGTLTVLPLAIEQGTNRFTIDYTFDKPAAETEDVFEVTARVIDDKSGTPVTKSVRVQPAGKSDDTSPPVVTGVTAIASRAGTLRIGDTVTFTVTFGEPVMVAGTPGLRLLLGSLPQTAIAQPRSNLATTVDFTYTVTQQTASAVSNLTLAGGLDLAPGQIVDQNGNRTPDAFPVPATFTAIAVDAYRPGAPPVALASDTGISATDLVTQSPVVAMSAKAAGLMPAGTTWQWSADGGNTWSANLPQTATSFTLKTTGSKTDTFQVKVKLVSAGGNEGPVTELPKPVTVDTKAPTLLRFTSPNTAGSYKAGATIQVQAEMSEPVVPGGEMTVTLNTLPTATTVVLKAPANGGTLLTGAFTVAATQSAGALKVTALKVGTAGLVDVAGNKSTTITVPTGANNLDGTTPIAIDNVPPRLVSLSTTSPGGRAYREGAAIDLVATLSERPAADAVLAVTLNNRAAGPTIVELRPSATGNTLVGTYVVGKGDLTPAGQFLTVTDVRVVRAADVAGNPLASFTLASLANVVNAKITIDAEAPAAVQLALAIDSGASATDRVTKNGTINVLGLENGGTWRWSLDGGSTFTVGSGASFTLPAGDYEAGAVVVRQTDAGGNEGPPATFPAALLVDTGAPRVVAFSTPATAGRYRAGTIVPVVAEVSEAVPAGTKIVATLSTLATVTLTAANEGTTLAGQYVVADGQSTEQLVVRSFTASGVADRAGNAFLTTMPPAWLNLDANRTKTIAVDTTSPLAPAITLARDTGVSATDGVTSSGVMNVAGLEANAIWKWSVDGGTTFATGTGKSFILPPGSYQPGAVILKQIDLAGNESPIGDNAKALAIDPTAPAVQSFSASASPGAYQAGTAMTITATLAEPVIRGGEITAQLSNGRSVTLANALRSTTLTGTYTVAVDDDTQLLKVTSFTASRIVDVAGNPLTSTAVPGGAGNLGGSGAIRIDTVAPGAVTLTLKSDTGSKADDAITRDGTINVAGLDAGDTFKWSSDSGQTWKAGAGAAFVLPDGTFAVGTVRVIRLDAAGNEGPMTSLDKAIVSTPCTPSSRSPPRRPPVPTARGS